MPASAGLTGDCWATGYCCRLLGKDAESLLQHRCITIPSDQLYLPGADYVDRVMVDNNRPPAVLRNMQTLYRRSTGYLSILLVDQVA